MIVCQTPVRISFTGGGTDFEPFYRDYGGAVVSTTIDKYIYVMVKKRFDQQIHLSYQQTEMVSHVDEIKHDLIREAMRVTGITAGVDVVILTDIPAEGTGLGSSSALMVGLLHAMFAYTGRDVPMERLAELACDIEILTLGNPIGKQDQYIAALGGLRFTKFNQDLSINSEMIELTPAQFHELSSHLMLFYTGITRSASKILQEQTENIGDRIQQLIHLRDQSDRLYASLSDSHFDQLGHLLHEGWEIKRQLASGISNSQIDHMYKLALEAGAIGGKIAGAGGGGFLLLYAHPSKHNQIRQALSDLQETHVSLCPFGSRILQWDE